MLVFRAQIVPTRHLTLRAQYERAVKMGALVLDLYQKSKLSVRGLLEPADSDIENVRLKCPDYELIVSQHGNYTMMVTQSFKAVPAEEGEDGAAPAAPAAAE